MKKLFMLVFVVALFSLSGTIFAKDSIVDLDMRDEINKAVKVELYNQNPQIPRQKKAASKIVADLINVIEFNQDIFIAEGLYYPNGDFKSEFRDCIAIVIDDDWAIASKKCRLSKGDKLSPSAAIVDHTTSSKFKVLVGNAKYNVNSYETKNLFLLRAIASDGSSLFSNAPKAHLAFVSTNDKAQFDKDFGKGVFLVNRTDKHSAVTSDAGDAYEDNFHAYLGVGRTDYDKKIDSLSKEGDNVIATISSTWINPKLVRAGDPLFYIQNGKKYLLGLGKAVNLWDNFDKTRSDKVTLLTNTDKTDILDKIRSVDSDAAARIEANILVK